MAEDEQALPGIDIRRPNMARMYNYALGGKDNFASDREAVQNLFRLAPENAYVPKANRQFLGTAVRFAAEQGRRGPQELRPRPSAERPNAPGGIQARLQNVIEHARAACA
jgi:hypothetical protein